MPPTDELLSRLDALAAQLGTTAEYLFGVLVQLAHAEGIAFLIGATISFGAATATIILCRRWFKDSDDFDGQFPAALLGTIGGLLGLVLFGIFLAEGLIRLLAPEGIAAKHLLQALGAS